MGSKEITPVVDQIGLPKMGKPFTRSAILKTQPTVPRKAFRHFPAHSRVFDALGSAVISIDLSAHSECPLIGNEVILPEKGPLRNPHFFCNWLEH